MVIGRILPDPSDSSGSFLKNSVPLTPAGWSSKTYRVTCEAKSRPLSPSVTPLQVKADHHHGSMTTYMVHLTRKAYNEHGIRPTLAPGSLVMLVGEVAWDPTVSRRAFPPRSYARRLPTLLSTSLTLLRPPPSPEEIIRSSTWGTIPSLGPLSTQSITLVGQVTYLKGMSDGKVQLHVQTKTLRK